MGDIFSGGNTGGNNTPVYYSETGLPTGGGFGPGAPEMSTTPPTTTAGLTDISGGGTTADDVKLDEDLKKVRKKSTGAKQLQIPLTSTGVSTGGTVDTGLNI